MAESKFDYEGAIKAGYNDEEILDHLASSHPDFDVNEAFKSGYSSKEINDHLSNREKPHKKEERGSLEKGARLVTQYGLGRLEGTTPGIVYDIGVSPANSKGFLTFNERARIGEDLEYLYDKNAGKRLEDWSKEDQEKYKSFEEQIRPGGELKNVPEGVDLSIRGLASKATGVDLHPEGVWEKAVSWAGFVKDPKKLTELATNGLSLKNLSRAILPYPNDIFRGLGAGTAIQMAEDGQWGPVGTIGAAILGDIIGHTPKGIYKVAQNPKGAAAQAVNLLTLNNTKRLASQQLADDFAKSNIKIDAGTLTQSPLVQMMQARLTQSGLTGDALDNFRKELSNQIVKEYESIIGDLGELTFENNHQAAEAIQTALKTEDINLNTPKENLNKRAEQSPSLTGRITTRERPDYQQQLLESIAPQEAESTYQGGVNLKTAANDIKEPIKEQFDQRWTNFNNEIRNIDAGPQAQLVGDLERFVTSHEGSLLLGESAAEARVLRATEDLLNVLRTEEGGLIGVSLDQLIKTRRTLADVANWEVAGSSYESAYKGLVADLNRAIERTLADNPELRQQYLHLNADYEAYKSAFENKNVQKLFEPRNENYNSIYNDFISNPDKLRSLEDIFYQTPRGEQLVNQVKRDYVAKEIEKPNLTSRDIRNLQEVLGPEFDGELLNYYTNRQAAVEQPLPQATKGRPLGLSIESPQTQATRSLSNRTVSETGTEAARTGLRKKMAEALKGKSSEQIMQQMNTVEGVRQLKKALQTTPEGKELFKQLSRHKLAELIDNKMKDSLTDQVKLGKFSNLLNNAKSKDLVRELIGNEAYTKLELLQKNSGRLAESAGKFFNASKSGTTLVDAGLVGTAATGVFLGNPYMAVPAILKIGGSYVLANLLSDPVFLRELEKAIRTNNPQKFKTFLKEMTPKIKQSQDQSRREED